MKAIKSLIWKQRLQGGDEFKKVNWGKRVKGLEQLSK